MRTLHKTTAIVAALGIAFSVSACGDTDSKPGAVSTTTPRTTASMPSQPTAAPVSAASKGVDASLKADLKAMAIAQETYIQNHVTRQGIAVAATEPGGTASTGSPKHFRASPGNVIAVKVYSIGYCISVYNVAATKAHSARMSMLYASEHGGLMANTGTC